MQHITDTWPDEMAEEVREHIHNLDFDSEYEYADNFRYARPNNQAEQLDYELKRERGCCGSYDVTLPSGIRVGFNYGH